MPTIITISIIFILIIAFIPVLVSGKVTPSELIVRNIYASRKKDEGIPEGFFEFIENNINDENRYKIKNNLYE